MDEVQDAILQNIAPCHLRKEQKWEVLTDLLSFFHEVDHKSILRPSSEAGQKTLLPDVPTLYP